MPNAELHLIQTWMIRLKPPSANDLSRYGSRGQWNYIKVKRRWKKEFPPCVQKATRRRHIEIERILGPRERPYEEGLQPGMKPVIDILKDFGWIVNDSRNWLTRKYLPEVRRGTEAMTKITLLEYRISPPGRAGVGVSGDERSVS